MKRPAHAENTLARIAAWRRGCPQLVLRSTFIVGFPGETEAEFQQLLDWLEEAQLDRVGAFKYSPVDGARANDLAAHVSADVQEERLDRFMQVAQRISAARLAQRVGQEETVLVDGHEGNVAIARTRGDAPEIDGVVRIKRGSALPVGEFARVTLTAADDYDFEAVPKENPS